jgi:hypothetical protein
MMVSEPYWRENEKSIAKGCPGANLSLSLLNL